MGDSIVLKKFHDYQVRAFDNLDEPILAAPEVLGVPGAQTCEYCATFRSLVGETTPGEAVSLSNAPNTLSGVNFVRLRATNVPAAAGYVRFFKKDAGVQKLLGEVAASLAVIDDTGQAVQNIQPPGSDTSGRPNWWMLLGNLGRDFQRHELMDLQSVFHRMIRGLGDTLHKDGDQIYGLKERLVSENVWEFTEGKIYLEGIYLPIPSGQVTLTGSGTEVVGIVVTPEALTHTDDTYMRNLDEGVDREYCQPGTDKLVFSVNWTVDDPNQIKIREFIDGQPKLEVLAPERTMLDRTLARRTFAVSGSFVVDPFPLEVAAHPTDAAKLRLLAKCGEAYPNGFEVRTKAAQPMDLARARETLFVNESASDPFSIPGGSVITSEEENFDVDGLNIKLTIGSGNSHTVALTGNGQTAAQVGSQIASSINAYPTSGTLVICTAAGGHLQIKAADGKSLAVQAVASDCYTELGISTGTYEPVGTRLYRINDMFVKNVTDISYRVDIVEAVTHNGATHIDELGHTNVLTIIGASNTAADAHDHKWDYQNGVDFVRDGNTISFAGMGGAEPNSGATYYVAYAYNRLAVKGSRSLIRVVDAQVVKGAEDGQDDLVFTGATAITRVINGEAVGGLSGAVIDAVRILRVNDSPGQSQSEYNLYSLVKNSTGLAHGTSKIDWSAAGEQGGGATGQPITAATYYVSLECWYHEVEGDLVVADSYDLYAEIESFSTLNLRDCLDFRTVAGVWPTPEEDPNFDYEYYLGRIDKLVLSDQGNFSLITGAAAKNPPIPPDQTGLLSIAIVQVPPYTYNVSDVSVVQLKRRRLTQEDLQELKARMERVEYWSVVNNLEKEVAALPVAVDFKGLFTDALTGFGRMDMAFNKNGIRHTAALDRQTRTLMLPATREGALLSVDLASSTNVRRVGNSILLDYQPEVFDQQLAASIRINCAPDYVIEDYYGTMTLSPSVQVFMDENQAPDLNSDFDDNLSSAIDNLGAQISSVLWGDWFNTGQTRVDNWREAYPGQNIGMMVGDIMALQQRSGVQTTLIPGSTTVDVGDRVVDLSLAPMLRTKNPDGSDFEVHVRVDGLVPNSDHVIAIAGKVADFVYDSGAENPKGAAGTHTYEGKTTVATDNSGRLTGKFVMPEGVTNGEAPVNVFHYSQPTHSRALASFLGAGMVRTTQSTSIGIPTFTTRTETVTQTQAVDTGEHAQLDPIAETFLIPAEGATYLSAVGLFFAAKSATQPFTIQIRTVVNGYPSQQVLASCTLEPADISVSADGSVETVFTFEHVLGYQPGNEFCFVPMPGGNSTDFEVWAAELGAIDAATGEIIGPPMADGVAFHSPNGRTWDPWTRRDLKYKLYKSNFENNCQIVFHAISGVSASRIAIAVTEFIGPGTTVIWSYALAGSSDWIPFRPGIDVVLEQIVTEVQLRIDVTSLGGSYQILEQIAGILFLLHETSGYAVWNDQLFTDPLAYPNKVACYVKLDTDGTNGNGVRSITPKYSVDDGEHLVDMLPTPGYIPIGAEENFYIHEFQTPEEATITGASNTTPIVLTSENHGHQENEVAVIADVGGNTNANGTWRLVDVTADTVTLVDPDTGADSVGNGEYTDGGTMNVAEFSQMRPFTYLETTNQARTPKVRDVGFVCSRV